MALRNRKQLARSAAIAALRTRSEHGLGVWRPISAYDLASSMGIDLWFCDIPSLEGMYIQDTPERIFLPSDRPQGRRHYSCAHEIAHSVFGHGTKVDELKKAEGSASDDPEEFLAQCYAGYLLLPKSGVERCFAQRGWNIRKGRYLQYLIVANLFGVSYRALITHLAYGLGILAPSTARELIKMQPKEMRKDALGHEEPGNLFVVDEHCGETALDVEVGDLIACTLDARSEGQQLLSEGSSRQGLSFRVIAPGIARLRTEDNRWALIVRCSRLLYAGRGMYRHLPEEGTSSNG